MSVNRTIAPEINPVNINQYNQPEHLILSNGIPVYMFNAGEQDVVKLDFIFNAGYWHQPAPLIASSTNQMIIEGTKKYSALQISEKLDYYGAFLTRTTTNDQSIISLYSLGKFLHQTLEILQEILLQSIFPEDEMKTMLNKRMQLYMVEMQKTKTLSKKELNRIIFGAKHPYSNQFEIDDYKKVDRQQLIWFFNQNYHPGNCKIIVAGKFDEKLGQMLETLFGKKSWQSKENALSMNFQLEPETSLKHYVKKEAAVQSSISMGKVLFNRLHPDFMEMKFLTLLFGGYFGSRLMKNIREDKGYTYGISARYQSFLNAGVFSINTEVKADVAEKAVKEIYLELDKICNLLVNEDELNRVRKFALGSLLTMFDGPFAIAESFKIVNDYGLDFNYYKEYIEKINRISAQRIKELANKYLNANTLYEVVAGP